MKDINLSGWNYIVYALIRNNFKNREFSLHELYQYEEYFKSVYPSNFHIKDKLRQIVQHLRDKNILESLGQGLYRFCLAKINDEIVEGNKIEFVYLLSNDSIPGWVKIGRTDEVERTLNELYNLSVPLPFKVEKSIGMKTLEDSKILVKSIYSIIDTLNPNHSKHTEASKREFVRMTIDEAKSVFILVEKIVGLTPF